MSYNTARSYTVTAIGKHGQELDTEVFPTPVLAANQAVAWRKAGFIVNVNPGLPPKVVAVTLRQLKAG